MPTKDEIIEFVMVELEKEYSNDPNDNGGETLWGITRVAWLDYTGNPEAVFPPFGYNKEEARKVYEYYWDKGFCDLLSNDINQIYFPFVINSGYVRAIKVLQDTIGVKADGIVGAKTKSALQSTADNPKQILFDLSSKIMSYYCRLDDFGHFGRGWLNRLLRTIFFV